MAGYPRLTVFLHLSDAVTISQAEDYNDKDNSSHKEGGEMWLELAEDIRCAAEASQVKMCPRSLVLLAEVRQ